jgi:ATP-dependent RNA helicase RhlE
VKFEEFKLDARLNKGINDMGYTTPSPIQEQAIPHALQGRDILGLAQTGTGKTAAFMLPILHHLLQAPLQGQQRQVRALIVAPTRELAEQIHETAVSLGKYTKIRSLTVYGGVNKTRQVDGLRRGPEIVVACPGRLLDLVGDHNIDLSKIEILVLDEADRMFDMGFLPDIKRILKLLPVKRQNLLFSATMPPDIRTLTDQVLNKPVTVQIGHSAPVETVSHALYPVTDGLKKQLLFSMLDSTRTGRVLIFTRTKHRARILARDLEKRGQNVEMLQGNMSQNRRQNAINGFRDGKYDILVATDIAARGIDVAEISHVINFDMPDTVDAYTHRIGRTGRASETGEAFTFSTPEDEDMVRSIEKVLRASIERRRLAGFDYGGFSPENRPQPANGSQNRAKTKQPSGGNGQNGRRPPSGSSNSNGNGSSSNRNRNPQRSRYASQGNGR